MKKKIGLLIVGIVMLGIVGAFYYGETFTSEEFKERNINTEYFCTQLDAGTYRNQLEFYFECLSVERISANNWSVQKHNVHFDYPLEDFNICIESNPRGRCLEDVVKPIILEQVREYVYQLREDTLRKQEHASGKIIEDGELIITDEEING